MNQDSSANQDLTTLICLFHHPEQAQAALEDVLKAGVPEANVTMMGAGGSSIDTSHSSLAELNVPERDINHLLDGLRGGGSVLTVSALSALADKVEAIFADHKAGKIDETVVDDDMTAAAVPLAATETSGRVIPVVAEELNVGKRTVDAGGVRVYRRVVEIPVEQSVSLRDQHVVVERHAVDRPVTEADLAGAGAQTIELTETAEEAVVGKTARVVEEVHVSKDAAIHTEHITETVRRTEIAVEDVPPAPDLTRNSQTY